MSKLRTHYMNLQVTENASPEVIKGAYKYLCQKWHPDKHPGRKEEAERVTKLLNEAYSVLIDPQKRQAHDRWIAEERKKETGSSAPPKPTPRPPPQQPESQPPPQNETKGWERARQQNEAIREARRRQDAEILERKQNRFEEKGDIAEPQISAIARKKLINRLAWWHHRIELIIRFIFYNIISAIFFYSLIIAIADTMGRPLKDYPLHNLLFLITTAMLLWEIWWKKRSLADLYSEYDTERLVEMGQKMRTQLKWWGFGLALGGITLALKVLG